MKKRGETLFIAALIIFSAAALWESYGIAGFSKWSSPGVFPMLASATMLVCGLFIYRDSTISAQSTLDADSTAVLPPRVIVVTVLLALYVIAMPTLGFLLCSGLFLFISISYLWKKPLLISLCTSLVSLLIIHLVFRRVFQVVLPEGTFISWLF